MTILARFVSNYLRRQQQQHCKVKTTTTFVSTIQDVANTVPSCASKTILCNKSISTSTGRIGTSSCRSMMHSTSVALSTSASAVTASAEPATAATVSDRYLMLPVAIKSTWERYLSLPSYNYSNIGKSYKNTNTTAIENSFIISTRHSREQTRNLLKTTNNPMELYLLSLLPMEKEKPVLQYLYVHPLSQIILQILQSKKYSNWIISKKMNLRIHNDGTFQLTSPEQSHTVSSVIVHSNNNKNSLIIWTYYNSTDQNYYLAAQKEHPQEENPENDTRSINTNNFHQVVLRDGRRQHKSRHRPCNSVTNGYRRTMFWCNSSTSKQIEQSIQEIISFSLKSNK